MVTSLSMLSASSPLLLSGRPGRPGHSGRPGRPGHPGRPGRPSPPKNGCLLIVGLRSLKYLMSPTYQTSRDVVVLKLTDITTAVRTIKSMPGYKNVIVDIPLDSVSTFMRVASEHDLLSAYFHFHFTTMVSKTVKSIINWRY